MDEIGDWALEAATAAGASYADVRVEEARTRSLTTKNGKLGHALDDESQGVGVRVICGGAWGFAASDATSRGAVEVTARRAVEIARASARVPQKELRLAAEPAHQAVWVAPCRVDPFTVSVERGLDLLLAVDKELRAVKGVTLAEAQMHFQRQHQLFLSSEGSRIEQTRVLSGAGYVALAFANGDIQKRSYPNSFGGQYQLKGYELIDELDLLGQARRVGEEAVALHQAAQCPQTTGTLILDSSQLGLQIHESIGHPIELDRVLGTEANFAGMSFLTLDKWKKLRYGSPLVHVVADARLEHGPGLGTFAY
ncbi:MAG: TldD/PmbA family protein, partial [Terriglobales bacterium]